MSSDREDLITANEEARKALRVQAKSAWVSLMVALDGAGRDDDEALAGIDLTVAMYGLEKLKSLQSEMRRLLAGRRKLLVADA